MPIIKPHGNKLITCFEDSKKYQTILKTAPTLELSKHNLADIECISTGVYSPLNGFLNEENYLSVINNCRLTDNTIWPIPITLPIEDELANQKPKYIQLKQSKETIALLKVSQIFTAQKELEAKKVYGTTDNNHPGVKELNKTPNQRAAGKLIMLKPIKHKEFNSLRLTPKQTREYFKTQNWNNIAAFQTRNPLHRAHEYLQKCALEMTDGLMLHPLVGATKSDDVPANVRIKTYTELLSKYYPKDRVLLSVFPAAMRYAGPREAILHALSRKNYGISHFIVGRDHAGVGDYYGTYDAQKIFDQFTQEELGINILKFEHAFYCKACQTMASSKTCPHESKNHVHLSGTKVREMLKKGKNPPKEFTRPEVAKILVDAYRS